MHRLLLLLITSSFAWSTLPATPSRATTCSERFSLQIDGLRFRSSDAVVASQAVTRTNTYVRAPNCGGSSSESRLRISKLPGVSRKLAVAAGASGARSVEIFLRHGSLGQLRDHPLHRRLYSQRHQPLPSACDRRRLEIRGRVRATPAFEDLVDVQVASVAVGVPLSDDGESATVAITGSTQARVRRRAGAPSLTEGDEISGEVSVCADDQLLLRTVRTVGRTQAPGETVP